MDQSEFLQRMAILERAQRALACHLKDEKASGGGGEATEELRVSLEAALRRLLSPAEMGSLYKFMAISSTGAPVPTPFEHLLSAGERKEAEQAMMQERERTTRKRHPGAEPVMPDF